VPPSSRGPTGPSGRARRPEQRRRTTGTGTPRKPPPRQPGGLTTRAAVLALLVCALLLALTVPMREYLAQRARVARLEAQVDEQQRRVDALEARKQRLQDPAYVEQLARERLHFVRPGEIPYILLTPSPSPSPTGVGDHAVTPAGKQGPWYTRLYATIETAGAGKRR
jgi:cell division protein FtsB